MRTGTFASREHYYDLRYTNKVELPPLSGENTANIFSLFGWILSLSAARARTRHKVMCDCFSKVFFSFWEGEVDLFVRLKRKEKTISKI